MSRLVSNTSSFLLCVLFLGLSLPGWVMAEPIAQSTTSPTEKQPRKFYEYKGDYRGNINKLKENFKESFGYELVDYGSGWKPDEIKRLHSAFSNLPEVFYRLPGLTQLFRSVAFPSKHREGQGGRIPAATYPKFSMIYRQALNGYQANFADDQFRLELYDALFSEGDANLENIVHHEMGHAVDISNGMLSFQAEWLQAAQFRILNLPPLDARPDTDYIYSLINDPEHPDYAPVSDRHLPTYSRENPQEDFANSVAAYMHYPYFQYSHPKRYQFLKEHVFQGKDFFPTDTTHTTYKEKVIADAKALVQRKSWQQLFELVKEVGRSYSPEVEKALVTVLYEAIDPANGDEGVPYVARATCYLYDPGAIKLRRQMAIVKRVKVSEVLKHERCLRVGQKVFSKDQVLWPVLNAYFFMEKGKGMVQFLDPVDLTAHSRSVKTVYQWRLIFPEETGVPVVLGSMEAPKPVTGSVKINLNTSAFRLFKFPEGVPIELEIKAERTSARGQKFVSTPSVIRFSVHPWFDYAGPNPPDIKVRYAPGMMFLEKKAEVN